MKSFVYDAVMEKTNNGLAIPHIERNGIEIPAVTVFEDIILRNQNNLETVALEINGTQLTYGEFIEEVEKYMRSFASMGFKEHDVVSLCMPVCVEFICSYYALTTLGVTCNALNIMFLLSGGAVPYLDERCSDTLICDETYLNLLLANNVFENSGIKNIIVSGDATYAHLNGDGDKIMLPEHGPTGINLLSFNDFLSCTWSGEHLPIASYNEERMSTLNYTSGTTGRPKCMGHSDFAPLFLNASQSLIKRNEYAGDRTLVTIPLQHPTGLFYSMVFQMAQGKTLVLEPRYDKRLFSKDIISLKINHAVQAKPFYAQLIQDRADGLIKPGDFELFRNAYSGGEGIPLSVCREINDTLRYAGCKDPLILGYGRSEEGSVTIAPYNIDGRENTAGVPIPGIRAKIVDPETLEDKPHEAGVRGEILISSPVMPIHHCYLDAFNKDGLSDGSVVDKDGVRWARPGDIAEIVKCTDGTLSYSVLGRATDHVKKDGKTYYLFDLKERISDIASVQECEVLSVSNGVNSYITAHLVLTGAAKKNSEDIIREICRTEHLIDGVKIYDVFGINATSGKCDREAMQADMNGYYYFDGSNLSTISFS